MFYIYGLHLEGDDEIRYVGSTCNPQSRLWAHLRGGEHNPAKDAWVASNPGHVRMKILQSNVAERERRKAEQMAIKECQNKGHRLFNARRATNGITATVEDVTWWLDRIEGDNPF